MTTEREPEADTILRRKLMNLRGRRRLVRRREALDEAVSMVIPLFDAVVYRDLRDAGLGRGAGRGPVAGHPSPGAGVPGVTAAVAYDVIDYFARTGNWTHQWVTLRNLATC